jgi:hypothetical protein
MTTLAMNHSIPICQSFMGRPRIHKPKAAEHTSGALFREVVGAVFEMMIPYAPFWKRIRHSRPTSIYGFGLGESEMPPPVNVNQAALYDRMADGFKTCLDLWREIFSDDVYGQILDARSASLDRFDFPIRTWVRVLFETAVAFKKSPAQDRDRLLEALAPLYYGKTLSFVRKTERMTIQQTEEFIENECVVFEENKPYLVERWPL